MPNPVESVKSVSDFLRASGDRTTNLEMQVKLRRHAETLDSISAELVRLLDLTKAIPPEIGSIHDLPDELVKELTASKTDELEDQIVTVINAYGGEADLDQILVGLFRKFKVIQKRRFLQNKLYRMEMVWSVEGKKGVYTTTEPQEESYVEPEPDDEVAPVSGYGSYTDMDDDIPF